MAAFATSTYGRFSDVHRGDGNSHILTRDITEEELAAYKAHPDAYFGIVQPAGKKVTDVYELFEWMVECYRETPKDKLLEFCRDYPDVAGLATLDHMDLVLEVCERWAAAAAEHEASRRGAS